MRRRHAIAALGLACADGWAPMATAQDASGRVAVPDARLLDQGGGAHRLRTLCDQSVVIGFFYTGCSTVCPPQTAMLRALRERLDAAPSSLPKARLLSITVDPLGDSPEAMRAYAQRFELRLGLDAGWLMLTGDAAELRRVWTAFGVPVGDPEAHSSLLWLGSARGRWTRASSLTPTDKLVDLLRGVAT
ncbi:MAG: SCO family protein [Burkholderiales bacterium]|uniref:SCO family protein n=1 Tax=Ottowia pentelensis TaxID=511108 RepID=A0ABV6PXG6_9BURK|nr:SCO family protein [Ottowia sp.]MBN9406605.1 SCO family protein [Burkholderiales bacterium]MBS0404706.1 SCO family protein [Pseudomonadota bacterium]MBS0413340.1 SCO family protein [Pseudomonadota bacterium]HMN56719.1 SCO family protein [Ottowia sp.]